MGHPLLRRQRRLGERGTELADPSVYDEAARRNRLLSEYQTAADKLEELTARWETAMAALEAAKAEFAAD